MSERRPRILVGQVYVSADKLLTLEPESETDYYCDYGSSGAYFSTEDLGLLLFPEEGRDA